MYLVGHGSYVRPRLVELQYQRIRRYRELIRSQVDFTLSDADVFIDFRLPKLAMGQLNLHDVPAFERLLQRVRAAEFKVVLTDLDYGYSRYESAFVRESLEDAGANVFNVFTDDGAVFERALNERFGTSASVEDVTEASDFVCFFPSLTSEVVSIALRRELEHPAGAMENFQKVKQRIDALKVFHPYGGGGRPFIEDRLNLGWRKSE